MSDEHTEQYEEFVTEDGPGSADGKAAPAEQEAHGGSMAPGLVDDAGNQVAEPPPNPQDRL